MAGAWPSITWMPKSYASALVLSTVGVLFLFAVQPAAACPFCTALAPTLAQLREQAVVVALAEVKSQPADGPAKLLVHRVMKGAERVAGDSELNLALDAAAPPGALVLIFGNRMGEGSEAELIWHAVRVDETSYAYFARIPPLTTPTDQRLR